jgi:tetratricopeptide (TPR) repeat protein
MGDVAFALGDIETAAAIWREYLPNDDLLWRADAIARAGRYKLAEQFLVDMEQWEDGLTRAQLRRLATLLARLATSYSADRDFAQAAYYWQLAIDTIPKPNYYRGLGVSLAQEQRWQEAIVALGTAIVLEPDEPDHLLALAFVYRLMGRDDQAILVARAALQIAPNNQRALRFLNEIQR